jgi:hypothetical protein
MTAATVAPTVADSGTIYVFDGSATAVTLPTCAIGLEYTFIVGTTISGATTVVATAGDFLYGSILRTVDGLSATHDNTHTQVDSNTGVDDTTLTLTATTKGGIIGSRLYFIGMAANKWYVTGTLIGSGTQITGFS